MKTIFSYILFFFLFISYSEANIFDVIDDDQIDNIDLSEPEQEEIDEKELEDIDKFDNKEILESKDFKNENNQYNTAIIRILNKILAKNDIISLQIDKALTFENLNIIIKACFESNESIPDSKALIEINSENKKFNSWIFANNPALAIFEHPIYNVTLVRCKNR